MLVEAGLLRAEVLFMKQSVLYDALRASVEAAGKSLDHEVRNLFASPVLATALLDVGATFGTTPAAVSAARKLSIPYRPFAVPMSAVGSPAGA